MTDDGDVTSLKSHELIHNLKFFNNKFIIQYLWNLHLESRLHINT